MNLLASHTKIHKKWIGRFDPWIFSSWRRSADRSVLFVSCVSCYEKLIGSFHSKSRNSTVILGRLWTHGATVATAYSYTETVSYNIVGYVFTKVAWCCGIAIMPTRDWVLDFTQLNIFVYNVSTELCQSSSGHTCDHTCDMWPYMWHVIHSGHICMTWR